MLYHAFRDELGDFFTYLSEAPDLAKCRFMDTYMRCTEAKVKESVILMEIYALL